MRHHRPRRRQREPHPHHTHLGTPPDEPTQPSRDRPQRHRTTRRHRHQHPDTHARPRVGTHVGGVGPRCRSGAPSGLPRRLDGPTDTDARVIAGVGVRAGAGGFWGLFEHDVRVGAADPERRHPRPTHPPHRRPRPRRRQQPHPTRLPVHQRRRITRMQRRRQHPMPQRHHHLDHPTHPRRRLRMPHIRLQRPQPHRLTTRPPPPIRRHQRVDLNRIAKTSTRPMPLDDIHISRRQTRRIKSTTNHTFLRPAVRRRQTIRRTILIHRTTPHHRQNPTPLPHRIRKPLQHQNPRTLRPPRTIRTRRKRPTPTIPRQPTLPRKLHKRPRRRHHRHPTRQRHPTLTPPQRPHRHMQRHQRRRTRRIHRHRRPLQTKHIRHPPRQNTAGSAGHVLALEGVGTAAGDGVVVERESADVNARVTAPQGGRVDTGALERLPAHLQQDPLLRIHRQRLTRRNPKELRVKTPSTPQKTTPPRKRRPRNIPTPTKKTPQIPPTVTRKLRRPVTTLHNQIPQILRRTHPTRKTARHAHDDDGILRVVLERAARGRGGQHVTAQVADQGFGSGMVEDQGGGQGDVEGPAQQVAQFDGGQRVEAEVLERALPVDALR